MASFFGRIFTNKTKSTMVRSRASHRLHTEQLEPKYLLARLFAISTGRELFEVDSENGDIVNTLPLPAGDDEGDALGYDGADLWYATPYNLYRLDPESGAIRRQWTLPNNVFRDGLAVTNGLIYLQESSVFETIDVFSPATGTIIETIDLADSNARDDIPGFVSDGMAGFNGQLLLTGTDLTNEEILFVDPDTGDIVDRFDIDLDFSPSGLAIVGGEVHVGSAGDIVHVYSLNGTFIRDYTLATFFDNVVALGGDGAGGRRGNNDLNNDGTNDRAQTSTGAAIGISSSAVLSNDNIEGFTVDGWEIIEVTQPDHGLTSIDDDGNILYDPEDYIGPIATFQYTAGEKPQELSSSDRAKSDWYGFSVDIDGVTSVVGAPAQDSAGLNAGAVYINERNDAGQWVETHKLVAGDPTPNSQFGRAVAISGDTLVVGAWLDDHNGANSGSAYIFDRDVDGNWSQSAKLLGWQTSTGDFFGSSVDISGDTVVVGAPRDDPSGRSAAGAAFVFERNQGGADAWGQVAQLVASDGSAMDLFGGDVSIDGDTVVAGAHYADAAVGEHAGAVYIFARDEGGDDQWGETQKVTPGDLAQDDHFGAAVSIDGDQLAIGSPMDDFDGTPFRSNSGSVYVYEVDPEVGVWGQTSKVFAEDPGVGDRLGSSVSLASGVILSGADYGDYGASTDAGAAYLFHYDEDAGDYVQVRKLVDKPGRHTNDHFGVAVAISESEAIIGAHRGDSSTANNIGTAHLLDVTMTTAYVQVIVLPAGDDFDPSGTQKRAASRRVDRVSQPLDHDQAVDSLSSEFSVLRPGYDSQTTMTSDSPRDQIRTILDLGIRDANSLAGVDHQHDWGNELVFQPATLDSFFASL